MTKLCCTTDVVVPMTDRAVLAAPEPAPSGSEPYAGPPGFAGPKAERTLLTSGPPNTRPVNGMDCVVDDHTSADLVIVTRSRGVMNRLLLRLIMQPFDESAMEAAYATQRMLANDVQAALSRLEPQNAQRTIDDPSDAVSQCG